MDNNYCRCCLANSGTMLDMQMTEVSVGLEKISYVTSYHFCMGYEVPKIEESPKICVRCSVKLEDSYVFIKNSMKVYEILNQTVDTKLDLTLGNKTNHHEQKQDLGEWWPKPETSDSRPSATVTVKIESVGGFSSYQEQGVLPTSHEWFNPEPVPIGDQIISISDDEDEQPDMDIEMDVVEHKFQPEEFQFTTIPEHPVPSTSQKDNIDMGNWFSMSQPREIREDARTTRSQSKSVSNESKTVIEIDEELLNSDESKPCELYDENASETMDKGGANNETAPADSSVLEKDNEPVPSTSRESANATPVNVIYDFKCRLCPETFKSSKVLATHVKLHRPKTGAECLDCNEQFNVFYDVTVHLKQCHTGLNKSTPMLRCLQCEMPPLKSELALKIHLLKKHYHRQSALKFHDFQICKDCGLKFQTVNSLYKHRKNVHTTLRHFKCPECPETFMLDYHAKRHFAAMHSTEKNYKCAHCPEAFRAKPEIERHVREHFQAPRRVVLKRRRRRAKDDNVKNECAQCGKCFKYRCYLEVHLKRHERQPGMVMRAVSQKIRCAKCPFSFSNEIAITMHMKYHSEQTKSECAECSIPFLSYNDLNMHLKIAHKPDSKCPEPTLKCLQCEKPTFKNAFALKLHMTKRHLKKCTHTSDGKSCKECEIANSSERCYRCKLCAATFKNKPSLDLHLKRHLTSRILKFRCPQCSKQCGNDVILKIHLQFHSDGTRSECVKCDLKFPSYFDLSAHLKTTHESEDKEVEQPELKCSQCTDSSFKNAFALRCHLHKMHLSTKTGAMDMMEHKCTQCNKLFKNRQSLASHLAVVHTDIRKYECNKCTAKFKTNSTLKCHMKAHEGEQNFKCVRCQATFRLRLQLTRHIKMHYQQRRAERLAHPSKGKLFRFKCKVPGCYKAYKFKGSLASHASVHKNERDFPCLQCPSKFKTKSHLDRHVKRHTMKSQFLKCEVCPVYCMNEPSLKTHVLLHSDQTACECIDCDLKFTSYNDLTAHCKIQHKIESTNPDTTSMPSIKCGQCVQPPFKNIFTLKCHILKQHLCENVSTAVTNLDTQCEVCKKQFLYKSELKTHMITHAPRNFKCKLCAGTFKSSFALGVHLKRHLESKSLKNRCATCSMYCGTEAGLATHMKLHSEKTGSECLSCTVKCSSYNDLVAHIKDLHRPESDNPMPMLKCNRCTSPTFKNLFALKLHFLKKHLRTCKHSNDDLCQECATLERNFQCKLCLASFKNKFALDLHLKRHLTSNVLKFRCSQCAKRCGNETSLKSHMLYHSDQTAGECTDCNLKCPSYNDLSVHCLKNHTDQSACPSPTLKCTTCDCAFKNMLGFKLHLMRIHLNTPTTEVPELRCQSCDKIFTTKQGLNIHMVTIHSDVRNFACTLCPLKFKQAGHLKVHLTTHSDKRDFKCNQCSADFKLQSVLNKHLRNHLKPGYVSRAMQAPGGQGMLIARRPRQRRMKDENENHECPTCGKVFKFRCSLEKHMQTHSDLRNFICTLCAMAFKSNQHLQTHFKRHQKKSFMKHKCLVCASICRNQFTLRKHMKLHSDLTNVECMDCAEKYPSFFQLIDHLKEKHDGMNVPVVKCSLCEADKGIYKSIHALRSHMLSEHRFE